MRVETRREVGAQRGREAREEKPTVRNKVNKRARDEKSEVMEGGRGAAEYSMT